jgi:hypothetical protein
VSETPLEAALGRLEDLVSTREAQTRRAQKAFDDLAQRLVVAGARMRQQGDRRMLRPPVQVDAERVRALVAAGRLSDLTPREARFVARNYAEFPTAMVLELLALRPNLARTLLRQLLAQWHAVVADPRRSQEVAPLLVALAGTTGVISAPIDLPMLFTLDAPAACARALKAHTLLEAQTILADEWLFNRTWPLTGFILSAMLLGPGSTTSFVDDAVASLGDQSDHDDLRRLLLPVVTGTAPTAGTQLALGPRATRRQFVSSLLLARFGPRPTLGEGAFSRVEPYLVDGQFGDPRVRADSEDWAAVQRLAPAAFQAFFESLVRGDLEFFFARAMSEPDRKRFWLGYTKSIRRTVSFLDARVHASLRAELREEGGPLLAAVRRARPTHWGGPPGLSAFCLFFDRLVAVEFSITGNALFFYERSHFEREILPAVEGQRGGLHPSVLKDTDTGVKFVHVSGWSTKVRAYLRSFHIEPDPARPPTPTTAPPPAPAPPAVAPIPPSRPPLPNAPARSIVDALASHGPIDIIDKRAKGGNLWVIDSPRASRAIGLVANELKVQFHFERDPVSTQGRPAWWTRHPG